MSYTEEPLVMACADDALLGILSIPQQPSTTGVLVIVGGPQYRAGSHRQFVLLARALAGAGHAVLRFDYRGMGDSSGDVRAFTDVSTDIAAAINAMQKRLPAMENVVLWGLCDGASAALLYCHDTQDSRVSGLCLLNPWVRSEVSLARTQVKHYYTRRLLQPEFWAKLASGKVALNAATGLIRNLRLSAKSGNARSGNASFQQRMAIAWRQFPGRILLLLSGDDYTAKEFVEYAQTDDAWLNALQHPQLVRYDLPGADHTFSNKASRLEVENMTRNWLNAEANGVIHAAATSLASTDLEKKWF